MNILLVNWLDRENPLAGGAEIHVFEIFRRLVERGHRVRMVTSGWPGCPTRATVQGIEVTRVSTRNGFALRGRRAVRAALSAEAPDIVVEDINKLPLYLATLTRLPFCVIVPHLFGTTAFEEAAWPVATVVWAAERPIPRLYRRAGFHAISESTAADLVARGVPAERVEVIHPGVDSVRFSPDPSTPRTDPPSFLYVGRLKRYKGVDVAIRALAVARRSRPELRLEIAGSGITSRRWSGWRTSSASGTRSPFTGTFRSRPCCGCCVPRGRTYFLHPRRAGVSPWSRRQPAARRRSHRTAPDSGTRCATASPDTWSLTAMSPRWPRGCWNWRGTAPEWKRWGRRHGGSRKP